MRRTLLILGTSVLALLASCTKDELKDKGPVTPPPVMDDASIDPAIFSLLDRDDKALEHVFALYDAGSLYNAAAALLEYFRSRTGVYDDKVNMIDPFVDPAEMYKGKYALTSEGCRFYTEGFTDKDGKPYSYLESGKINWTKCGSKDPAQTKMLSRLGWIEVQGLLYRTETSENREVIARDWVFSMDSFISFAKAQDVAETPVLVWNREDAAPRLDALLSAWQYFMNSRYVTPAFNAKLMAYMAEETNRIMDVAEATDTDLLRRCSKLMLELDAAQNWLATSKNINNKGYKREWFELLNLDHPALSAAKAGFEADDYAVAAAAVLEAWRGRDWVINPLLVKSPSASDKQKLYAYDALREKGYRFYVKNFDGPDGHPQSYLNAEGTGIDWQKWPSGKDQEERYQIGRHQWMEPQAITYAVTGDETLVQNWMEVYKDWFAQNPRPEKQIDYGQYPGNLPEEDRNFGWTWRPLDVSARVENQYILSEYYKTSPSITPEYWLWYLSTIAEQVEHIKNNYSDDSNHRISQASAVAGAGILFPEFANSGEWADSGVQTLNGCVKDEYFNDGWLKDGDFQYHIGGIESFRSSMEYAKANGKYDIFPDYYTAQIKKMADVVLNMTYPDYSAVNMCDTRSSSYSKSVMMRNYTRYASLFPEDKAYEWMASGRERGAAPTNLSALYTDAGYYVLRSGWNEDDIMMVLQNTTCSPAEKWHRQWDNNTFELYVKGRRFFTDSGCYTYTTGSNRRRYASTAYHNTLTLDGKNVEACKGEMLKHEVQQNGPVQTEVLVLSNPSYSNLTHRRTVFFVDRKYFVIVDDAYGNAEGEVAIHFHLPQTNAVTDAAKCLSYTDFPDGNNLLVKTISDQPCTLVSRTGYLSVKTDEEVERPACKVAVDKKAEQGAVRFVTVIYPCSNAVEAGSVISASLPGSFSEDEVRVSITVDGATSEYFVSL